MNNQNSFIIVVAVVAIIIIITINFINNFILFIQPAGPILFINKTVYHCLQCFNTQRCIIMNFR